MIQNEIKDNENNLLKIKDNIDKLKIKATILYSLTLSNSEKIEITKYLDKE